MARLLFLDTMGAGRVFQAETNALHERFARLIQGYLDEAVAAGVIPPIDTRIASIAWFGALNEVVARWLLADHAGRLEDAYPALRAILLRSVGVAEERIERVARARHRRRRRLPGEAAMTAVRPGSGRTELAAPALGPRLAALLAAARTTRLRRSPRRRRRSARSTRSRSTRRRSRRTSRPRCGCARPTGSALVGVGRAWATEPEGPDRFAEAERAWRELLAGGSRIDGREPGPDGRARVHGPATRPTTTSGRRSGRHRSCSRSCSTRARPTARRSRRSAVDADGRPRPADGRRSERRARELEPSPNGIVARPVFAPLTVADEQPAHEAWDRLVGMFAGAVGRGRIDKVVLARRVGLRSPVELDVPNALRRLAASAPESTTFAFRRGGRTFLGSTPERLARTEGRSFRTMAVAGSIRRGADAAEDAALAAELLALREGPRGAGDRRRLDPRPAGADRRDARGRARAVGHDAPVRPAPRDRDLGHAARGARPALAGRAPAPDAGRRRCSRATSRSALVDEHEGFDRGWYAGPIGWLGADGDGELCVALRCGIVDRTRATLFAGCGIVADSDPDAEWEESRMKLRAVVSALGIPADER